MSWIFSAFAVIILFLFGGYWCYVVFGRLPKDIKEIRESHEPGTKTSIVVIWIITVIIAVVVLVFGYMLAVVLISELGS